MTPVSRARMIELLRAGGHDPQSQQAREVLNGERIFIAATGERFELDVTSPPPSASEAWHFQSPGHAFLDPPPAPRAPTPNEQRAAALIAQLAAIGQPPRGRCVADLMASDLDQEHR